MTRWRPRHSAANWLVLAWATLAVACGGGRAITGPIGPGRDTTPAYAGFDIARFPGAAALAAWKYPSSPYRWVGYYLPAPCHRDTTWSGQYASLAASGWGVTAIYVGQQDWANIPTNLIPVATTTPTSANVPGDTTAKPSPAIVPVCSASLLSSEQGAAEAADAIAKLRADGFPNGTTIFLDIEGVTTISQALIDYYRGWMTGVANDGRYRTGVYTSRANAQAFHDTELLANDGTRFVPTFWVAGSGGFSLASRPTDVGLSFAELWQGAFNVTQTHNGVTLTIDVNVSSKASPSAP